MSIVRAAKRRRIEETVAEGERIVEETPAHVVESISLATSGHNDTDDNIVQTTQESQQGSEVASEDEISPFEADDGESDEDEG